MNTPKKSTIAVMNGNEEEPDIVDVYNLLRQVMDELKSLKAQLDNVSSTVNVIRNR